MQRWPHLGGDGICQEWDFKRRRKPYRSLRPRAQRPLRSERRGRHNGEVAEEIGPDAVLALGDTHHYGGVQSTEDPLWMTNYELIYDHPELMVNWYPVCGNHEYRGNTQAVVDYSNVSRRWKMPARYYSKVFEEDGTTVRVVFLDTTPLIDKYHKKSDTYPDARKQDAAKQLQWLDSTLSKANEDWIVVVGHHPVYAFTDKSESEKNRHAEEGGFYHAPPQRRHVYLRTYPQLSAHPPSGFKDRLRGQHLGLADKTRRTH